VVHKVVPRAVLDKARAAGWPHDGETVMKFAAQLHAAATTN